MILTFYCMNIEIVKKQIKKEQVLLNSSLKNFW